MAGTYTAIDLSQLPAPSVIETLEFQTILDEILADMRQRDPVFTALVESDPAYKQAEVFAYREMLMRQRVNDASRAVMLAYAKGSDLDQIGANQGVLRLLITPANPTTIPPTPAVYEPDEDYRRRIQLAPEGYTTAGSEGSYVFHSLGADADVKDAAPLSPTPGVVSVYVLSRTGNGAAPDALLAKVDKALNRETTRPMTDLVNVLSANIVPYSVNAELVMYPGPDAETVRKAAEDRLRTHLESLRRIGYDVNLSGIYAALHQSGVQEVKLKAPLANITIGEGSASFPTSITVTTAELTNV